MPSAAKQECSSTGRSWTLTCASATPSRTLTKFTNASFASIKQITSATWTCTSSGSTHRRRSPVPTVPRCLQTSGYSRDTNRTIERIDSANTAGRNLIKYHITFNFTAQWLSAHVAHAQTPKLNNNIIEIHKELLFIE